MIDRRTFLAQAAALPALSAPAFAQVTQDPVASEWEYIVVGSGAGGGTVAARLAEYGHSVLLLEAGGNPLDSAEDPTPEDYRVPAFHLNATENQAFAWEFFVRHYSNSEQQKRDPKYCTAYGGSAVDGVMYPRVGGLGGCTAHNAMILVCPSNEDWDALAQTTGDETWSAASMRGYFQKLENCHYRGWERFLHLLGINPSKHGYGGWLPSEIALPLETLIQDKSLLNLLVQASYNAQNETQNQHFFAEAASLFDPNDWRLVAADSEGARLIPLTTGHHARSGTLDRLLSVRDRRGLYLRIETDALATRVLFDGKRASGVEYREGTKLYQPYGTPRLQGQKKRVRASREVILCGGAFNTPQLLMLSGIGPEDQLSQCNIDPVKILDGVGRNLQDRYEVGVVSRLKHDWNSLKGATFSADDPHYQDWQRNRKGVYTSNGTLLGIVKRSKPQRALPDLFCYALGSDFHGYFPGYSKLAEQTHNALTWAVLKARTENHAGRVTLQSADPLIAPKINFHYFEEGSDTSGEDLDSVVEGIRFVRKLTEHLEFIAEELLPGPGLQSDDELRQFVRHNAWGHHASCTCKIGKEVDGGVLGPDFTVHGVTGLRVVDASIFPRIPGCFIVAPIYIAAEKAADVIHQAALVSKRQGMK